MGSLEARPCRGTEVLQPLPAGGMETLSWLPLFTQLALLWPQGALPTPPIRVFVVPHGHMDVGWLHRVEVGALSDPCTPLGATASFFLLDSSVSV